MPTPTPRRPRPTPGLPTPRRTALALVAAAMVAAPFGADALTRPTRQIPDGVDVRNPHGVPTGLALHALDATQLKVLRKFQLKMGRPLTVQYNGLTATPRHLFSTAGALTAPSPDAPELIARRFLRDNRSLFRFSDEDLNALRLRTRSTAPGIETTIMVFEQRVGGLPVYHGDILVNVSKAGEVLSVGNENYPQLSVTNTRTISPAQAVTAAAAGVGVAGYAPAAIGARPVLSTYGLLTPEFVQAESFAPDSHFSDEIHVTPVVFPLGATARQAWRLNLTDRAHYGMMWENVVDAETGAVLSRLSLTAFDAPPGNAGGGTGVGRRATFRPDIQDTVEANNTSQTAVGRVFDTMPSILSGVGGFGRSTRTGTAPNYSYTQPTYGAGSLASSDTGYNFRYLLLAGRNENGLPFADNSVAGTTSEKFTQDLLPVKLGQVLRGLPDAAHPTASSPFGWFYLPTDTGGAETAVTNDHATTRAYGYTMDADAQARNKVFGANGPAADGSQPFAAGVTPIASPVKLGDGRTLSGVFQSSYTEGNNVVVSDDRANDNASTRGVRAYSANRQFTTPFVTFANGYEYGGSDASGGGLGSTTAVTYPGTADPDVPPADVSLFTINNIEHDYLYSIGFTEPMWNFQQDNFGRGGAGSDGISAEVEDGSGTDNANFGTPAEGSNPTMQMYLFTEGSGIARRSDGSFDWDVVAHEHYHGVSTRSASKGAGGCLAVGAGLTGESGGQGEGWSDTIATSMSDDDDEGEYVTGDLQKAIRRLPYTNYRWSYGSLNGAELRRRDQGAPDSNAINTPVPFEVHDTGEVWAATLWDMRELLINKDPNGVFFDGTRRLGAGTKYYIGDRQVSSTDTAHPIDYRTGFNTTTNGTAAPAVGVTVTLDAKHAVRPGLLANEIAKYGNRSGPLATALVKGAKLADSLVLRGLQLGLCNPSFIDSRDSILLADQQMNGGENRAVIWRAFASHGVGSGAASTSSVAGQQTDASAAPVVVEDFTVPTAVSSCETTGPLASPGATVVNADDNTATLTLVPSTGGTSTGKFYVSRATAANGPYALIATVAVPATGVATYADKDGGSGLIVGQTYYYRVRESRDTDGYCVSQSKDADVKSITITKGVAVQPNPVFLGVTQVADPQRCNVLDVSWSPASSADPLARLVYDVYRVAGTTATDGTTEPTFTPGTGNKVQTGLASTSFIDTGLLLNQPYYYIVRARDAATGRIDTANSGNLIVKAGAPSSPTVSTTSVPFARETFEASTADTRFTPPLVANTAPDQTKPVFQRVANVDFGGGVKSGAMYAPDLEVAADGVLNGDPSDFNTVIGPVSITPASVMSFDSKISAEGGFDGGVIELSYTPTFNDVMTPDNTTTFDLGDYMTQGGYNNRITNLVFTNRRAFSGVRGLTHTTITLQPFAAGGAHASPTGQVYIRFRMTSDEGNTGGTNSGWYIDNLAVSDYTACPADKPPVAVLKATPTSGTIPLDVLLDGAASTDPDIQNGSDTPGNDSITSYTFDFGDGSPVVTQAASQVRHTYQKAGSYTAKLTVTDASAVPSTAPATQTITATDAHVDAFTFAARTDVDISMVAASETVTLSGTAGASFPISISGGTNAQYSINGGAFTSDAGTIKVGDKLAVRQTSSSAYSTKTTATVKVGTYSTTFDVTTKAQPATPPADTRDHVPDAFDFGTQQNVEPGKVYTSQAVTPVNYDDAPVVPSQVAYSIDGGPFTTAKGTIAKGQSIRVQLTSSKSSLGYAKGTVTIGGVKGTYTLRTRK